MLFLIQKTLSNIAQCFSKLREANTFGTFCSLNPFTCQFVLLLTRGIIIIYTSSIKGFSTISNPHLFIFLFI